MSRRVGWIAAALLALGYLLWLWYAPVPPAVSRTVYQLAAPAVVAPRIPVPVRQVQTIPKKAVKGLPAEVTDQPQVHVIDTAVIPPTKGGATTVTVLDAETGIARTLVKETPRPFISLERGTELGARYGGEQLAGYARRDLLRVGSAYLAVYGEVNSRPEAKAMLDVSVRW